MPAIQEAVKGLIGKEPHRDINPDEVVAIGAAVQAGIFQGDVKDVLLLDVTPLSLGIETLGGVMTRLIDKNTTIPTAKTQVFSTAADNQPSVEIHILQGEREMAHDNRTLGRFMLDGIPSSPRGIPQIEVVFDIDANGILNVSAKDKATNKQQSIRIEGSSGLSKDEIERMKQDAEVHAEEDRKKREAIEIKNTSDALVYTAEKTLRDAGDKISASDRKEVEEKIEALKKVKEGNDTEAIKRASEELSRSAQKLGQAMYQAQQQNQQEGKGNTPPDASSGEGAHNQEKPTEGEYEDVKDEKPKDTGDGSK